MFIRSFFLTASLLYLAPSFVMASNFLIDDFSIDQAGFVTDQNAAFDTLIDSRLFGGSRTIWGGGASVSGNCDTTTYSTSVNNGVMEILTGPDCYGTGNVHWGNQDLNQDFSSYQGVQIQIAELIGITWTRLSIYSGETDPQRLDVFLDSIGNHQIPFSSFPDSINLSDVDFIVMSTQIESGEYVAFDSISLYVPEPSTTVLALATMLFAVHIRRR